MGRGDLRRSDGQLTNAEKRIHRAGVANFISSRIKLTIPYRCIAMRASVMRMRVAANTEPRTVPAIFE